MSYEQRQEPPDTDAAMLEVIRALRENPAKFDEIRTAIMSAKSDEEKVQALMGYATDERELAALVPKGTGEQAELAWTTVTVTTVFVACSAY